MPPSGRWIVIVTSAAARRDRAAPERQIDAVGVDLEHRRREWADELFTASIAGSSGEGYARPCRPAGAVARRIEHVDSGALVAHGRRGHRGDGIFSFSIRNIAAHRETLDPGRAVAARRAARLADTIDLARLEILEDTVGLVPASPRRNANIAQPARCAPQVNRNNAGCCRA